MTKKTDAALGMLFASATVALIALLFANDAFFRWAFERHQNLLSWYIRPLFVIPLVFFAFRRSWSGMFASMFALFTSMFWFPPPEEIDPRAEAFLAFEMDYLRGAWTAPKIAASLAVPVFFLMILSAAWKRKWRWLIGAIAGGALLKVFWSVAFGGESGASVVKPALLGLLICVSAVGLIRWKHRKSGKRS